jgi:glycosyltransferase 2 family protein
MVRTRVVQARIPLMRRRWVHALATLVLGLVLLISLVLFANPVEIGRLLRQASLPWILAGLLLLGGFLVMRGWRWQIILAASAPNARFADATAVTGVGWAVNSVSPFKVGDVLRAATIAGRAGIGFAEAFATVVLERIMDVFSLLIIAVITIIISGNSSRGSSLWQRLLELSGAAALVAVVGYVLVHDEQRSLRWWSALSSPLPAWIRRGGEKLARSALRGFRSMRSPSRLMLAGAVSLLMWTAVVFALFAFFRALSGQLAVPDLLLAMTLFTITQAISVTPASLGTYEFFFVLALSAFGASPPALLTAVAVLSHLVGTAFYLLIGGASLVWLRLTDDSLTASDGVNRL